MEKSTIGAQLYTLRDYCKDEEGLKRTLHKVREIGYETVQVSGIGPIAPEVVKRAADDAGVSICATHVSFDEIRDSFEATVEKHKLWGCSYVGIGGIPVPYREGEEGYVRFAHEASEQARKLKEQGLQFIYHNHAFEYQKYAGRTAMDILREESDPGAFGFELDTYWVQAGGANPVEAIYGVKGRMGVIHLKDMAIVDNKQVFAEIGEGNMNFREILKACRETGVEWYVVEQDVCPGDPFESLAISYRYLSGLAE